jgi:hypothetical protein
LSIDPKRGQTIDLYIKEREGKLHADCQSRSAMLSTSSEPSSLLTEEDDGKEEKMTNCLSIKKEGKLWTVIQKREKENSVLTAKAGAQCQVPVPSPPPRHWGR